MPSCWALPDFVPHQEMSLLHRFRRRAYPYVGRAVTAGEAIFLARRAGSVRAETAVSTVRMQPRGRQRFGALQLASLDQNIVSTALPQRSAWAIAIGVRF